MTTEASQTQKETPAITGVAYDSYTYTERIGCGHIHIIITENKGKFHRIFMKSSMSKETPCGSSWLEAMSALLTFGIRRALEEKTLERAILKHLRNHRCNQYSIATAKSCSDAIAIALTRHFTTPKPS